MYGTKVKDPMQRVLYYLSFNNLAAVCAIMALASRYLDSLHGRGESSRSLRHTTAAVKAVNELLQRGRSAYDDATIYAVGLLATAEVRGPRPEVLAQIHFADMKNFSQRRFGSASTSKQHWVGLKKILAQRGGLRAVCSNRHLEAMLVW